MMWDRELFDIDTDKGQWHCHLYASQWNPTEMYAEAYLLDYEPKDMSRIKFPGSKFTFHGVDGYGFVSTCRFTGKDQEWVKRLLKTLINLREDGQKMGSDFILKDGVPFRATRKVRV